MSSPFPTSSYLRQSSLSSCDGSDVPEIISASSLQSFPESDNDSLSSSARSSTRARSPASSPRSIFERYWSSPQHIKSLETDDDDDEKDAFMARLQTLQLPLTVTVNDQGSVAADKTVLAPIEHKKSFDDDFVDYHAALAPQTRGVTRTPRRQILPTPPPPTAVSSSLLRPRGRLDVLLVEPLDAGRKSRSSSALLGRRQRRSCLRRSRYSCSAIASPGEASPAAASGRLRHELRNDGFPDLRAAAAAASSDDRTVALEKSVSFHSRVSVLEFAVPREEEQRGREG